MWLPKSDPSEKFNKLEKSTFFENSTLSDPWNEIWVCLGLFFILWLFFEIEIIWGSRFSWKDWIFLPFCEDHKNFSKLSWFFKTHVMDFNPSSFSTRHFPEVNSITSPRLHTTQKQKLNYFLRGFHYEEIWCFFIRFSNMIFHIKEMTLFSSKALKWKKNLEEKWGKYEVNLFGRWYE